MRRITLNFCLTLAAAALLVAVPTDRAAALDFKLNEAEWLTWPDYCRARYLVSGAGRKSNYVGRVSAAEIDKHRSLLGAESWHWLHHHCAGLIYIDRARLATSDRERRILLDRAQNNVAGQFNRTPRDHWFYAEVAITLARIHRSRNELPKALEFLKDGIAAHPTYAASYSLASVIYRDMDDLVQARDILLQGNEATGGKSAEIHYFLGLVFVDRREFELAVDHAAKAYELGYPLPGLRSKLQRLGYDLET